MPFVSAADAPVFRNDHATFVGLAAPSRGATHNCTWRLTIHPETAAPPHALDHEEIFIALSGRLNVELAGETLVVEPGDALIVPAHTTFAMTNPDSAPFEAQVVVPVGTHGLLPGRDPFIAPWAM